MHRRAREGLAADKLEGERRGLLEGVEVEAIGELARRGLQVALGELGLA